MPFRIATILIVDDYHDTCEVLSCLLQLHQFKVLRAENGWPAISRAENSLPELILLDIKMSGIDGLSTCQILKSNSKTHEIPIIFMTSVYNLETKLKGFQLGAVDYITKPFEAQEILATIKTQLSLKQREQVLQQQNK